MSASTDLYRIVVGARVWTVTSGNQAVKYGSGAGGAMELYVPVAMGRSGVTIKNELSKANLDVRLPLRHELSVLLLSSWLEQVTTMTVFRKRVSGTRTIWKGRLASVNPGDENVKLVFESIYTSLRRPGLRARFLKSCRHPLYGRGCYLDPEAFAHAATVSDISGRLVTSPEADAQADGFYDGGMIRAPDGTLSYIAKHVGAQLELNRVPGSLTTAFAEEGAGMAVTLYPGCDHSYGTCAAKFANDLNYGGFDYIPSKNPMGGSSIV